MACRRRQPPRTSASTAKEDSTHTPHHNASSAGTALPSNIEAHFRFFSRHSQDRHRGARCLTCRALGLRPNRPPSASPMSKRQKVIGTFTPLACAQVHFHARTRAGRATGGSFGDTKYNNDSEDDDDEEEEQAQDEDQDSRPRRGGETPAQRVKEGSGTRLGLGSGSELGFGFRWRRARMEGDRPHPARAVLALEVRSGTRISVRPLL